MTITKKRAAANHEAGHAIIANALGFEICRVTILPKGKMRGSCEYLRFKSREAIWRDLAVSLAGAIAQWKAENRNPPEKMRDVLDCLDAVSKVDADNFRNNLQAYCGSDLSKEKSFAEIYQWTEHLLDLHANGVKALSDILMSNGTMEGDALRDVLNILA
jgi:hypothetical protein